MKILIIGATGMLAKPVIKQLDQQGFDLRLFSRSINASMFDKHYEIIQGDLFNPQILEQAMRGCDAVHINLSKTDEALAVQAIVTMAKVVNIKLITTISGSTVAEENRWFWMTDNKYKAEQSIINSGIPYIIFRLSFVFESLALMIQDGKATIIGKQSHPFRWIAADDVAKMVTAGYQKPDAKNKIYYGYGPQSYLMRDVLHLYVKHKHPEIKNVSSVPAWLLKLIAKLTKNSELKLVASIFGYFDKVIEPVNADKSSEILGGPRMSFDNWLEK